MSKKQWLQSLTELLRPVPWATMVNRNTLRADCISGLTGAAIVLPQGIAFAAIAGLPPEYGFYTAMVQPFIAALFGSSWHLVSGPTTAISVLVFAALADMHPPGSEQYIQAAITLAFMVGVIQFILGLARMGQIVNFVSHSVMFGFTAGAAVLIALSQLNNALGLSLPRPEHFSEFVVALANELTGINWATASITAATICTALSVQRYFPRSPYYLVALLAGSLLAYLIDAQRYGVALVGTVPDVVPRFAVPQIGAESFRLLSESALAIALIGLLEAVSVARALAIKSGQSLHASKEFVGQGLSNGIGAFFGAYPGSGSFTRSGVNYDSGARTPMAAIFASLFLLIILLAVAPLFAYLPVAAMAAVIMLVAWRLIDVQQIIHIVQTSRSQTAIVLITFLTAIFISLEFAIYAGVLLSLAIFLQKSSHPFFGITAPDASSPGRMFRNVSTFKLPECPQMVFARLHGPLYFGSLEHLQSEFNSIATTRARQKHLHLNLKGGGEIDLMANDLLVEEAKRRKKNGGELHLIVGENVLARQLKEYHLAENIGQENIHYNKGDAIASTIPRLDMQICRNCRVRIFTDCPKFDQ